MEIINISPRGYCYGVVDAMIIARNAVLDQNLPRPIYLLGMIVHNQHITEAYEKLGIQTLVGDTREDILAQIDHGTVIFTAHGTSPEVKAKAKAKGLVTIDATCPDVAITHELIRHKVKAGYEICYIGKKSHPEPEGAKGIAPNHVHLISTKEEASNLFFPETTSIFVTNQTTMSQWDVADIMDIIQTKYPHAQFHKEICQATQQRQSAVAKQGIDCDLILVVGDPKSNNTNRLAQVAKEQANVPAYRISDVSEINPLWLTACQKVGVTAGASTPTAILREVLAYLTDYSPDSKTPKSLVTEKDILPKGRVKDITKKRQHRFTELRKLNQIDPS